MAFLTVVLSVVALGAAWALRSHAPLTPGRRTAASVGLFVPGALSFSTVGRLWYLPGILLLGAFGLTLAAGMPHELGAVLRVNWTRAFVSVLGAFEVLMAASAGPVVTVVVGMLGGFALMVAPWLRLGAPKATVVLLLVGALPFAARTWWSVASPALAVAALAIGFTITRRTGASHRYRNGGSGRAHATA